MLSRATHFVTSQLSNILSRVLPTHKKPSLSPNTTHTLNDLVLPSRTDSESPPTFLSSLYKFLLCWFISSALASTLISIPVSLACLPFVVIALVPAAIMYLIVHYSVKVFLAFMGPSGLLWKTIGLIAGKTTGFVTEITRRVVWTVIGLPSSSQKPTANTLYELEGGSTEEVERFTERFPERYRGRSTERSLKHHSSLHHLPRTDSAELPESDLASIFTRKFSQEYSLTLYVVSTANELPVSQQVEFKLLDSSVDMDRIHTCSALFTRTSRSTHSQHVKVGLSADCKMVHHILSLWNTHVSPEQSTSLEALVGFVEFFHKVQDPRHVFIEKLLMNSLYEGHGYSRKLIKQLQSMDTVDSIEVWSLWRSEPFYKNLGFVDVVAMQEKEKEGGVENKRVVGEWGPLLIYITPDVE